MGSCCSATAKQVETGEENCLSKCCGATICHATAKCTGKNADFLIDVGSWKQAFGGASPLCSKCLPPMAFLAVRAILFFFWLGVVIWRAAEGSLHIKYLTHWTLMFELFYLFFALLSTFMAVTGFHGIPDGKGKATPWFISVAWASQGTALVMSVLVFLLYWILDYSAVCGTPAGCPVIDFANIAVHGLNALVMIIDATICRMPFHLAHIFMPMIYAVAYLTFNVIWQVSGNGYVYLVLDWQGDGSKAASIAGGVVVVVVPLFFVICWCLTRARGGCSTGRSGIAPVPEV